VGRRSMSRSRFKDLFITRFRAICARPAMFVGEECYKLTAIYIDGVAMGYEDADIITGVANEARSHAGSLINREFQRFLAKKYQGGNTSYSKTIWHDIIPMALEGAQPKLTDRQLIDRLLADFEDFNNVLIRMAVETAETTED